jgi:L-seryl-tRNA(Ser) seleniumtransferase
MPDGSVVHGPTAAPRHLPSVDRLLRADALAALRAEAGDAVVAAEAKALLAERRASAAAGTLAAEAASLDALAAALATRVAERTTPHLKPVFNCTGTVLHTNLGRATLAEGALAHAVAVCAGPSNLEFDLASGGRGDRDDAVEGLLAELTGCEAATVVNNNAAAVLLAIAALARGKKAIVSRGELVEIGGAFRMPDVMASAGATMVEVGTTNRTHLRDYAEAIDADTALVLKVHTSNYAVQGFTKSVFEAELAPLCRERGVWLATDLGSGALVDLSAHGLPKEPMPQEMLAAGCDVVTFSGDKLLGGPQAGLIVGKREPLQRIRTFPMKRALRVSKLPLAALEATLALYRDPARLAERLPTLRHLVRPADAIRAQAEALQEPLRAALGGRFTVEVVALQGQIGSGSLPIDRLPSAGLAVAPVAAKGKGTALDGLARALRALPRPVVGRIAGDRLLLDLRCVDDADGFARQLSALPAPP